MEREDLSFRKKVLCVALLLAYIAVVMIAGCL